MGDSLCTTTLFPAHEKNAEALEIGHESVRCVSNLKQRDIKYTKKSLIVANNSLSAGQ
jgi:hypothetical protein